MVKVASVKDHYDNFLAEHYTWMFGDYNAKVIENRNFFDNSGITPRGGMKALDLGCGSGFQSIALAQLGFKVIAIDLCEPLLEELRKQSAGDDIDIVRGNILDYRIYADKGPFEVAVCMGDTLTHLESIEDVLALFEQVYDNLEPRGGLALTFRDMTTRLQGTDRIIPVRGDDNKIMAAFLEYEENYVNVHDLIFIKTDLEWNLEKSVYRKLRISTAQTENLLQKVGFWINFSEIQKGFSTILAQK